MFQSLSLSLADPKALNYILVKHPYKYPKPEDVTGDLDKILGPGLVSAEGEAHKRQRRLLNPFFSPARMKSVAPVVHTNALQLAAKWTDELTEANASDTSAAIIDVLPWLNRITLNVIGEAGFGHQLDPLDRDSPSELAQALRALVGAMEVFEGAGKLKTLLILVLRYFPTLSRVFGTKQMKMREQSMESAGREAKKLLHSHVIDDNSKDILSSLVRAQTLEGPERDRMSEGEVIGQIITFLFAGHETSATAITWSLYLLAKYPEVQTKLRAELVDAIENCEEFAEDLEGMPLTLDKVNELPYLDAFCREGFRLYPPVPLTVRVASQDDHIPLSKPVRTRSGEQLDYLTVPAGQLIAIPMSAFNIIKEVFGEDAELFDPERWMGNAIPKSGTGAWAGLLTFFAGARACIGYRFVLVEIKIILLVLVTRFKFEERDVGGGPEIAKRTDLVLHPVIKGDTGGPSMPLRISLL